MKLTAYLSDLAAPIIRLCAMALVRSKVWKLPPPDPARYHLFIKDYVNPETGQTTTAKTQREILAAQIARTTEGPRNRTVQVTTSKGYHATDYMPAFDTTDIDRSEVWASQVRYTTPNTQLELPTRKQRK